MNIEQAQCLLGVAQAAPRQEIVSAHRRLVSTVHPDRCDGPEAARLARQATEARDVLLAPVRPAAPALSPAENPALVDDVLLRHVRFIVDGLGAPVDALALFRTLRADLRGAGVSADDARLCCARVFDDDFLALGAARGYWDVDPDGVRPVGWVPPPADCRGAAAPGSAAPADAPSPDSGSEVAEWAEACLRSWLQVVVRWAAAVAAAGMFWSAVVGCVGVLAGAFAAGELLMALLALPVVFLCVSAAVWILRRFDVDPGALSRPAVGLSGLVLSIAFFLLLVS